VSPFGRSDYGGNFYCERLREIGEGSKRWAFGAAFQLADVALGISQIVRQFCLAQSAIDPQSGNLSADSFT
jgi:hypothetical protein